MYLAVSTCRDRHTITVIPSIRPDAFDHNKGFPFSICAHTCMAKHQPLSHLQHKCWYLFIVSLTKSSLGSICTVDYYELLELCADAYDIIGLPTALLYSEALHSECNSWCEPNPACTRLVSFPTILLSDAAEVKYISARGRTFACRW